MVHAPTFRLNSVLFPAFLILAIWFGVNLPERYPIHFNLRGEVTNWAEGPGMWILLVALCSLSFLKLHLFQRFLIADPDSQLLNVPHKKLFQQLPRARKVPVIQRANRLLGLCNTGMLLIFTGILFVIWFAAHNPASPAAQAAHYSVLLVLILMVAFPLIEAWGLSRMVKRKLREEGLLPG